MKKRTKRGKKYFLIQKKFPALFLYRDKIIFLFLVGLILLLGVISLLYLSAPMQTTTLAPFQAVRILFFGTSSDLLTGNFLLGIQNAGNATQCGGINASTTLNRNVVASGTCFTINASNIILDGRGYTLIGNGSGAAIDNTAGHDNITIRNFVLIQNFSVGIDFGGVENSTIYNNTINLNSSSNPQDAIRLQQTSARNNISSNNITLFNEPRGIQLGAAVDSFNSIFWNFVTGYGDNQLVLLVGNNNTVSYNVLRVLGENSEGFDFAGGGNNTISYNNVTINSTYSGIGMLLRISTRNNFFLSNTINISANGAADYGYQFSAGSDDNMVVNDSIVGGGFPVDVSGGNATFINVSFEKRLIQFNDIGNITVQWYLDINVTNNAGQTVQNVNVSVYEVGNVLFSTAGTNDGGTINRLTLTEFWMNQTETTYFTPHIITFNHSAYINQSTSLNITKTNSSIFSVVLQPNDVTPPALNGESTLPPTGTEDTANWNKNFSSNGSYLDSVEFMTFDSNGNLYAVGNGFNSTGANTGYDWWLKKFNSSGIEDTTSWNKNFSSYGSNSDIAYSVAIDSNNNVYVVGLGRNLTGSSSHDDWWIKKFNSSGTEDTTSWNKNFSSYNVGVDVPYSVAVDSNNNVYVAGAGANLTGLSTSTDWWIKKFNSSGTEDTTSWNKNFSSDGSKVDIAYSVAIDSNNNVYLTGYGVNLTGLDTSFDWWIKKFNSSGTEDTTSWNKNISSYDYRSDAAYSLAIDSNNNIYVAGFGTNLTGAGSGNDWWIKRFNTSGTEDTANWNKNFSSNGAQSDVAYSIAIDSNNNVHIAGYGALLISTYSSALDWWIKKFNSSGTEDTANWNQNFSSAGSNNDAARSVAIDSNDYIYVGGYGINLTGASTNWDWWIKKLAGAPTSSILPPLNSRYNISNIFEISANVTDQTIISKVFANLSYPNGSIILYELSNSTGNPRKFNISFTAPVLLGRYNFTIIANDTSNNYNRSEFSNFTVNDVLPPNVTAPTPTLNSFYEISNTFQITANVTDQIIVSKVFANLTYPSGSSTLYELSNDTQHKFNVSFTATSSGQYRFTIIANDTSNNYNRSEFSNFTVNDIPSSNTGSPSSPSSGESSAAAPSNPAAVMPPPAPTTPAAPVAESQVATSAETVAALVSTSAVSGEAGPGALAGRAIAAGERKVFMALFGFVTLFLLVTILYVGGKVIHFARGSPEGKYQISPTYPVSIKYGNTELLKPPCPPKIMSTAQFQQRIAEIEEELTRLPQKKVEEVQFKRTLSVDEGHLHQAPPKKNPVVKPPVNVAFKSAKLSAELEALEQKIAAIDSKKIGKE